MLILLDMVIDFEVISVDFVCKVFFICIYFNIVSIDGEFFEFVDVGGCLL